MATFDVATLPEVDQFAIKRGRCPWCLAPLYPCCLEPLYHGDETIGDGDYCSECADEFIGKLTIQD